MGAERLPRMRRLAIRQPLTRRSAPYLLGGAIACLVLGWLVSKAIGDIDQFAIVTLNELTLAALYFVVASGFTLIFGLMRVVNMAHGAFFLFGGYIALKLQRNMVGGASDFGL